MALPSYNCNFMTTLTPEQKEAQMASMKSFDEEMPSVGIFWYDPQEHEFFGVYKKELTPTLYTIHFTRKNRIALVHMRFFLLPLPPNINKNP